LGATVLATFYRKMQEIASYIYVAKLKKYIDSNRKMIYNKDNKRDSLAVVPARVFSS
jgi:hypothetical protein